MLRGLVEFSPIEDPEIKRGFRAAITKMYDEDDAKEFQRQWVLFANLNGPFNKHDAKEDLKDKKTPLVGGGCMVMML